jgi:2-keto-3-deoxy-L-fuconate dehydrogenase
MARRYDGKRVLVTCVGKYMGRPIADGFVAEGAEVIRDDDPLFSNEAVAALLKRAGDIDIVIANFSEDTFRSPVGEIDDANWHALFDAMVHPLMRIVRTISPAWIKRKRGKIIAVTSAAPLRGVPGNMAAALPGVPGNSAYCAARGAQNAFVRSAGLELAPNNIQMNAIAQNFVRNEPYYPDELIESDDFQRQVIPNIPTGKVADAEETAELALYLASDKCTHMVGQVIPWAGGWVTST